MLQTVKNAHDQNKGKPLIPDKGTICSIKTDKAQTSRLHTQKGRESKATLHLVPSPSSFENSATRPVILYTGHMVGYGSCY